MDNVAYSLGIALGRTVLEQIGGSGIDLDKISPVDIAKGIEDVISGKEPLIGMEEANAHIQGYFAKVNEQKSAESVGEKTIGSEFLATNKIKEGVVETESGLQYEVITSGDGEKPANVESQVTVHYHGTTIDGTVFDSSVDRGEPATFGLNQVIAGWTEGVQLMNTGSKYRFYIPSDLAYGDRGAGASIKPGSTLIFDVELLSVN